MEIQQILQADLLDILFEGRNKQYGAYDLRKTYGRRLIIAMGAMTVLVSLFVMLNAIAGSGRGSGIEPMYVEPFILENVPPEEKTVTPPPPPQKVEQPTPEIKRFTVPDVVKDELMKNDEQLPEQDQLVNTKIGTIDQAGVNTDLVAPPVEETTGGVEAPKTRAVANEEIFTIVQIEAKFPGGRSAWTKFLERNLNSNLPVENGAPPAKYTVVVSFLVDKDGNISEIKAVNDPGFGTAEEAVRVLRKSPKWQPAVQNGRNVIYRQKQSITFIVTEG